MDRAKTTATISTTSTRIQWTEVLVEILLQESLCSSHEEATVIVESIVEENEEEYKDGFVRLVNVEKGDDGVAVEEETLMHEEIVLTIPLLVDYLGVTEEVAQSICTKHHARLLSRIRATTTTTTTTTTTPDMSSTGSNSGGEDIDDDDDDSIQVDMDDDEQRDAFRNDDNYEEEEIAEGDCELCERNGIKLTKHHLIPKSTWKKLQPKLKHAWDAFCDGEGENHHDRVHKLLEGTTLFEFFPVLLAQEKKERRAQKSIRKQQQQQQDNARDNRPPPTKTTTTTDDEEMVSPCPPFVLPWDVIPVLFVDHVIRRYTVPMTT
jgi:hypothetical protein